MSLVVINLLPDVRLKRLREHHIRQTATTVMIVVTAVCGSLLVLGFLIVQGQNLSINSLSHGIADRENQINSIPNVSDILTTQQHLASLAGLYGKRVYLSTFFGILQTISPKELSISSLTLGEGNVITITGQANNYLTASRLARAMEVSGVTLDKGSSGAAQNDFTQVELSGLTSTTAGQVSFTIKAVAQARVTNGSN